MPRRGENIYKRKDGRWEGRYIRGRTPAGKAEYGYVYAKSYAACREKRRRMEDALPQKPMLTGEMSVCQAAEFFLSERRGALKASTIGRYEYMIRHYMSERKTIIRTVGLKKHYTVGGNTVRALDGVDMSVLQGEFVCVAGRSGSGKSTMLNMLAGLEPPTEGEIIVRGKHHLEAMDEEQRTRFRRRYIGFVFQSYNNLPQYTALENVALPLAIRGVPEDERNWLAWQALSRVGLRGHVDHRPAELSGGQQQRVSIARAIITEPSIVLADEPTGNLDSRTGEEVMELLCEIFRERNTTFILSSHDPQMERYTDRTVYFSDGKIETENHHTGEERTK